ncbi:MAG: endopeptidase La [Myxococcota bacterium]
MRSVRIGVEELLPLKNLPPEVLSIMAAAQSPGRLADLVASHLQLRIEQAQEILELEDPVARLRKVDGLLKDELEYPREPADPERPHPEALAKEHREILLRDQLRSIQNELGEIDAPTEEVDALRSKLDEANLPEPAREEAFRQLRRLERMNADGPEAQVVWNYLDWVIELPWNQSSPDQTDLKQARAILDEDHAHLSIVKERILEFLAVRKLRKDSRGPILCLTGPPGVGKTSLGRSIARSLGREFVRVSLGGVRDEAEIRGHRRTYVGAMPGRIIQGLKQAGTNNPVMMLDEIDKLAADARGDPSSALLEVLDPHQNDSFRDHFLNTPFDLSRVLFIATANLLESIPAPLRDRMEIIRLSGYTPEEKIEITTKFLIPRQIKEHGLALEELRWTRHAIRALGHDYTHEAGVRNLDRQVAAVCRKVARRRAEGDNAPVTVGRKSLEKMLGPPPYRSEAICQDPDVGLVHGLAWTEAGGEVLSLEANLSEGRGLLLTGQIGDVMKESGQTALSFVRSILSPLGANERAFARRQVHVHVPAGAIPKDGPSAGIAIATAMASLVSGIPVRGDIAMTGEVTIRGRVLPVGGIREKALAALRMGITTMILPEPNLADLREIPKELKKRIHFIPVRHMTDVLDAALVESIRWQPEAAKQPLRRPLARVRSESRSSSVEARGQD